MSTDFECKDLLKINLEVLTEVVVMRYDLLEYIAL
jgi:hypothetical protein